MILREHRASDIPALLELHRRCFAGSRSRAHHDWLHRNGGTIAVAETDEGRCVGMFAGVHERLWIDGREELALLGLDVAIAPELRTGLLGGRLLLQLGRMHVASAARCRVSIGFPEPPLVRTLVGKLGYEVLCGIDLLVRDVRSRPAAAADVTVDPVDRVVADGDALWQRCRGELDLALVRDGRHWQGRFLDHPGVRYTLLAARDAQGALRGLAAVRSGGIDAAVLSVMDWLVPAEDGAAEAALLAAIDAMAAAEGRGPVVCWFRPSAPQFAGFRQHHGFRVHGTPYRMVFQAFAGSLPRERAERWYLTLADLDFF